MELAVVAVMGKAIKRTAKKCRVLIAPAVPIAMSLSGFEVASKHVGLLSTVMSIPMIS